MKYYVVYAIVLILVVVAIARDIMFWNECRETNSFFYCSALLSR